MHVARRVARHVALHVAMHFALHVTLHVAWHIALCVGDSFRPTECLNILQWCTSDQAYYLSRQALPAAHDVELHHRDTGSGDVCELRPGSQTDHLPVMAIQSLANHLPATCQSLAGYLPVNCQSLASHLPVTCQSLASHLSVMAV